MSQYAGLDVKITMPNTNLTKRVKTPLSFSALYNQVQTMAQSKGLAIQSLIIRYIDQDGESVIIEDDNDLEMAYSVAFGADKRIKLIVESEQAVLTQSQAQAPIVQYPDVHMPDADEVSVPVKKQKAQKEDAGIPRKALKNLIQKELQTAAKESFGQLILEKSHQIG